MRDVMVVGVATTRFGQYKDRSYIDLGVEAVTGALRDAGLEWKDIQRAYCGAMMPVGPFAGNRVGHELGLTGVPIQNLDNASASGNSAFHSACLAVGSDECDIAIGFGVGQLGRGMPDSSGGEELRRRMLAQAYGNAMSIFALVARRRMHDFGTPAEVFGKIAEKSKFYGSLNPHSQIQRRFSLDEIMGARMIADPLTLPMCCPVGDGGAAVIVASREVARRLDAVPVRVRLTRMYGESFQQERAWGHASIVAKASTSFYEEAGVGPDDLDVVELHDATANEELEYYEALGLCGVGEADKLVMDGETGPGGRIPVNTDGGLISRGHPLGPTGCAQVYEITQQLRGQAGPRQVEGARLGLIEQTGAGEVFFLHLLER
jgi:benzoylsuccinyl-CoA thiolase BbsB subunit